MIRDGCDIGYCLWCHNDEGLCPYHRTYSYHQSYTYCGRHRRRYRYLYNMLVSVPPCRGSVKIPLELELASASALAV